MQPMWTRILSLLPLLALAGPAAAHHSFAMFDGSRTVKVVGEVKEFGWTNPHGYIHMVVANAAGGSDEWAIECGSPGVLVRKGWKNSSLKPGDRITVLLHPMRDGSHGGLLDSVITADGKVLGDPHQAPGIKPSEVKPVSN